MLILIKILIIIISKKCAKKILFAKILFACSKILKNLMMIQMKTQKIMKNITKKIMKKIMKITIMLMKNMMKKTIMIMKNMMKIEKYM